MAPNQNSWSIANILALLVIAGYSFSWVSEQNRLINDKIDRVIATINASNMQIAGMQSNVMDIDKRTTSLESWRASHEKTDVYYDKPKPIGEHESVGE
jgi:hypothetical protein